MTEMRAIATVIGDVVGSRATASRSDLHERLAGALATANAGAAAGTRPATPLRITIGDEFQGAFATLGEAITATWRIRLGLLPEIDLRVGLGWGPVQVLSEEPRVEDGPGWWAARAAIETVASGQEKAAMRAIRTAYERADPAAGSVAGPDPAPVNAALIGRDTLAGGLDSRSLTVLRGLLAGMTQLDIATAEGVSASAVSQRIRRDGIGALVAIDDLLGAMR